MTATTTVAATDTAATPVVTPIIHTDTAATAAPFALMGRDVTVAPTHPQCLLGMSNFDPTLKVVSLRGKVLTTKDIGEVDTLLPHLETVDLAGATLDGKLCTDLAAIRSLFAKHTQVIIVGCHENAISAAANTITQHPKLKATFIRAATEIYQIFQAEFALKPGMDVSPDFVERHPEKLVRAIIKMCEPAMDLAHVAVFYPNIAPKLTMLDAPIDKPKMAALLLQRFGEVEKAILALDLTKCANKFIQLVTLISAHEELLDAQVQSNLLFVFMKIKEAIDSGRLDLSKATNIEIAAFFKEELKKYLVDIQQQAYAAESQKLQSEMAELQRKFQQLRVTAQTNIDTIVAK